MKDTGSSFIQSNIQSLNKIQLPEHIAVILDGNGRWAKARGLKRLEGHRKGAEAVDNLLDTLLALNIPFVSLYVFSTENWKRPQTEISGLFSLLDEFIHSKKDRMVQKGIRLMVSGDISKLPLKSRKKIQDTIEATSKNKKLVANFCLNYGARDELLRALQRYTAALPELTLEQRAKALKKNISYKTFSKYLDTAGIPDVDLLIRTAGEKRLSNFLLLQSAYAELYFTDTLWPDFNENSLLEAIAEFQKRTRKYGGL